VTLDDLKKAIVSFEEEDRNQSCDPVEFNSRYAAAWRAAFEWLDQNGVEIYNYGRRSDEYEEVMRLIREKLR
jgi:hypothetical protein